MQNAMRVLVRASIRFFVLIFFICFLSACSASPTAGLEPFKSVDGTYGFLFPTGWTRVALKDGPEVVFHDLINSDETLSLVKSDVSSEIELKNIGTPLEVGERLINNSYVLNYDDREAELISANARDVEERTFYDIEYVIHLPNENRHEIATVVVDHGTLYTFAAGTSELRWQKVEDLFHRMITSFNLFI